MTTHIFIVDTRTFGVHLKYLFAGTGAKNYDIDFNNNPDSHYSWQKENMLVSMSADASRIRKADKILFYLQQNFSERISEGKFYGIFEAIEDGSFIDKNGEYLKDDLNKTLIYRTLIKPYKVYAEGVSEWEALDDIKNLTSPNQMLWSLIYRKLKGNRGNTMITEYESERLCQLLRNKNQRIKLETDGGQLAFDRIRQRIIAMNEPAVIYSGQRKEINILPRLIQKYNRNNAFEAHLQSYIVKNIGTGVNVSLDNAVLGQNYEIEWLGNEMSCGVGMQRIDIALSAIQNGQRTFIPIELKAVPASGEIVNQISRYIDWTEQYYIPNRQSDIEIIIIAKKSDSKAVNDCFKKFNKENKHRCKPIKYIEYSVTGESIIFNTKEYL